MATLTGQPASASGPRTRGPSASVWLPLAEIALVLLLWAAALSRVQPRRMTDLGLVSVLPWTGFLALAVMAVSFARVLRRPDTPRWLLAAYPLVLTGIFYLTPPILYGVPRYSWAWKHAGIVDFIQRTGGADAHIGTLAVYHNWPGFFAFNAMLTDLAGLHSPLSYVAWAEAFFNVLTVAAVMVLLRCLTDDIRTVVVGGWLFALGNWVGQGYWSPQAVNYLWYLLVIVVLLRWFPARRAPDGALGAAHRPPATSPEQRVGLMSVVLLLLACIVSTHQLTPLAAVLATGALVAFRRTDARALPLLTAVMTAAWMLYVASPFTESNLPGMVGAFGAVDNNVHGTLIGYGDVSSGLKVVSLVARGLTVAICVLSGLGFLAALRKGRRDWTAVILAAVPVSFVAFSSYGSEILFRAYLFALPGLVFFAALLVWPPGVMGTRRRALVVALTSLGLMVAFVFAQFGNDRRFHYTQEEVAAAQYVYGHAPRHSLLIEGSRNYPAQFENYDSFTYVPIDQELPATRERVVSHPASVLASWMAKPRYAAAFIIITRSQEVETESTGGLPGAGLPAIENTLLRSAAFRVVFHNRDAVVLVLAKHAGHPQHFESAGAGR